MSEKPIIFSTEMVRAILDGQKTVTRRVIKPQPIYNPETGYWSWYKSKNDWFAGVTLKQLLSDKGIMYPKRIPYQKGDILWVREKLDLWPGTVATYCDGEQMPSPMGEKQQWLNNYSRATVPSIHMPKWAARIWLEVIDVEPEKLQEITIKDSWEEGIEKYEMIDPRIEFHKLWDSLNAKRDYAWESNPWVWRIEFKRIEQGSNELHR